MINTKLYGKNLCNLLSIIIIKEFNKIDDKHLSEIHVVDVGNFIIVKGNTTIKKQTNYSQLFLNYFNDFLSDSRPFNVIDLITYNQKPSVNLINLELEYNSTDFNYELPNDLNNSGTFNVFDNHNLIIHNNHNLFNELTQLPEYSNYNGEFIYDNTIYTSDKIYGMNLMSEKIYHFFLKNIAYHIFTKGLSKTLEIKLFYHGELTDINHENIDFFIDGEGMIVQKEWLNSLILDVFDFNIDAIKKHLSLDNYDFENEILSNDRCWKRLSKISEMIIL